MAGPTRLMCCAPGAMRVGVCVLVPRTARSVPHSSAVQRHVCRTCTQYSWPEIEREPDEPEGRQNAPRAARAECRAHVPRRR
eukprot:2713001-Rhodomonas_salina.5